MARLGGIFLIVAATLLLELSLTRIFSVTMWYYFAFLAVSLALFGLAASGVAVHVWRARLTPARSARHRAVAALGFALTTPLAVLAHLAAVPGAGEPGLLVLAVTYGAAAVPFFCGGLAVSLALAHDPARADRLYAADLGGAGAGALLVVPLLNHVDGPGATLVIGAVGALAALAFAREAGARGLGLTAAAAALGLLAAAGLQARDPFIRIEWAKGRPEVGRVAEAWNAHSRLAAFDTDLPVAIDDWDTMLQRPHRQIVHAWGLSSRYAGPVPRQIVVNIDATAATPITHGADPGAAEHVLADVTAIAFAALDTPRVLLIGPGGGRDVIAALASGAPRVVAVELNRTLVAWVQERFGAVTGRPYTHPTVRLHVDDARAFLTRSREDHDLVMASMVDTWAASAAGAFALSENALYTREAFDLYWARLAPAGLLSMTRWAFTPPHETVRLLSLAVDLLRRRGVETPADHLVLVRRAADEVVPGLGIATLLLARAPFDAGRLDRLLAHCAGLGFDVVLAPGRPAPAPYAALLAGGDPHAVYASYPVDITPPEDDRPFFFHVLKPRDVWHGVVGGTADDPHARALRILARVLAVGAILSVAFLLAPLAWPAGTRGPVAGRGRYLAYFACLGLGFVLVELPLMQRFILFLGHPIYALAVALASLLVASGLGAFLAGRLFGARAREALPFVIAVLLAVSLLYRVALPAGLAALAGWPIEGRIAVACLLLLPLGLCLGMPLPLALRHLARVPRGAELVPWAWAVNGALSVFATVLATAVAVAFGFRAALLLGQIAYGGALVLACRFPPAPRAGGP